MPLAACGGTGADSFMSPRKCPGKHEHAAAGSACYSHLLVPAGTVGGRMAGTWNPCRRRAPLAASASPSLPQTMGMIGDSARTPRVRPTRPTMSQRCFLRQDSLHAAAQRVISHAPQTAAERTDLLRTSDLLTGWQHAKPQGQQQRLGRGARSSRRRTVPCSATRPSSAMSSSQTRHGPLSPC